jgi:anti-sigma regulatory factor (Ser/Thr protein kinase)
MVMTAQRASLVAPTMAGAANLEWLKPAVEVAAPASGHWPAAAAQADWIRSPRVATRTPGLGPASVKAARDFAVQTVRRWGMADLDSDVGVVVSELVTNALRHALPQLTRCPDRSPIRLGLLHPGPCVLCAVADPSNEIPVVKEPDHFAESGRGLHVIASLSDQWGWTAPSIDGKVVWAMFAVRCPS